MTMQFQNAGIPRTSTSSEARKEYSMSNHCAPHFS